MVFVYGTLMPGHLRWDLIRGWVAAVGAATVAGGLYDTGSGYPAARFDEPGRVEGWLLTLHPAGRPAALRAFDQIEGPQYRRVAVTTLAGDEAIGYEWVASTDGLVRLDGRWTGE